MGVVNPDEIEEDLVEDEPEEVVCPPSYKKDDTGKCVRRCPQEQEWTNGECKWKKCPK